jgi:hypothetical protein
MSEYRRGYFGKATWFGQPATERDLHPNIHLKVEGSDTVTTYNYTHCRNRTYRKLERI